MAQPFDCSYCASPGCTKSAPLEVPWEEEMEIPSQCIPAEAVCPLLEMMGIIYRRFHFALSKLCSCGIVCTHPAQQQVFGEARKYWSVQISPY